MISTVCSARSAKSKKCVPFVPFRGHSAISNPAKGHPDYLACFEFIDRQRGSHAVLKKVTPQGQRGCVIPMHREVALGTLRSALKMAGVSPEEFTEAL
jgi:predicted RNA binding protein YcfA (HicA-like mRNA interferase family)